MKVCIVDGYLTGAELTRRLRAHGVICLHIQSEPRADPALQSSFRPHDYDVNYGYTADTAWLAAQLATLGISRVIAGSATGVALAETLAEHLGLPTNVPELRSARRDKALAYQLVERAGLAIPEGQVAASAAEATEWFARSGLAEVVLRPLDNARAGVYPLCTTPAEVALAARAVLIRPNSVGRRPTGVIIQQHLTGDAYLVSSVSAAGSHRIAAIQRGSRGTRRAHGGRGMSHSYREPVGLDTAEARLLSAFTGRVLDAVGIRESAAQVEVLLTGRGPVFVDMGAHPGGTILDDADGRAGIAQATVFADSLVDRRTFLTTGEQLIVPPSSVSTTRLALKPPGGSLLSGRR
ncbi:hypothetical protein [Streptomyces californicus]|uniref:hypothetical protein n=1 Tax=Streptomyces californicus TaxID=67351 RepID=UPI00296FB598|nr:hypothetical protein [Streptomyces californicus]MDW4912639.1 hypothetical protein [Streptomyces californicus]